MSFRFERVSLEDVPWAELEQLPDRTVYQQRTWLEFLRESQSADPVIAAVHDGPDLVAWYTGAKIRRFGVPILGSPFRGWSSAYMGFNAVDEQVDRAELARDLATFAFGPMRCVHFELVDRFLDHEPEGTDWPWTPFNSWSIDLSPGLDTVMARLSKSCRANVRKAQRNGVTVQEEVDGFAALYYEQITAVFGHQKRPVPFPLSRVEQLMDHLLPSQRLSLVARREDGTAVGTGLFVGVPQRADLWGQASTIEDRNLFPNEAVMWAAISTWHERGTEYFEMGGGGRRFKSKFGGEPTKSAFLRASRWPAISKARTTAGALHKRWQREVLPRLHRP